MHCMLIVMHGNDDDDDGIEETVILPVSSLPIMRQQDISAGSTVDRCSKCFSLAGVSSCLGWTCHHTGLC